MKRVILLLAIVLSAACQRAPSPAPSLPTATGTAPASTPRPATASPRRPPATQKTPITTRLVEAGRMGDGQLVTIDLSSDGQYLAAGGYYYAYLYNALTLEEVDKTWLPTPAAQLSLSPAGQALAIALRGDRVLLWRWESDDRNALIDFQVTDPDPGEVVESVTLAWSPDGSTLAVGTDTGLLGLWDAETGKQLRRLFYRPSAVVTENVTPAWSPDGRYLISHAQGIVIVWDTATWQQVRAFSVGGSQTLGMVLSPRSGETLLALNVLGEPWLALWDWGTGNRTGEIRVTPPEGGVYARAWSPDGLHIAGAVRMSQNVHIWSADDGETLAVLPLQGETIEWSPDGDELYALTPLGQILVWRWQSGRLDRSLEQHLPGIHALAWDGDDGLLLAVPPGEYRWDITSGELAAAAARMEEDLSPDGRLRIIAGAVYGADGVTRIRRLEGTANISAAAWSPDSSRVAGGDTDGNIIIWEVGAGQVEVVIQASAGYQPDVAWSPDGRQLAVWGQQVGSGRFAALRVYDVSSLPDLKLAFRWQQEEVPDAQLAWSPDSAWLAAGTASGSIYLWRADGAAQPPVAAHRDRITGLAWSASSRLGSSSADGTAAVWQLNSAPD